MTIFFSRHFFIHCKKKKLAVMAGFFFRCRLAGALFSALRIFLTLIDDVFIRCLRHSLDCAAGEKLSDYSYANVLQFD